MPAQFLRIFFAMAISPAALAQDFELGARYWASTGMTRWAHSAQDAAPVLGNPTSVLTYENLDAHAGELYARAGARWFVKGNAGLGRITTGTFDDEDYLAGQQKFSDTTSSVKGDRIQYLTLDVGRTLWRSEERRDAIGVFAGWHHWNERANAYGASATVGGSQPLSNNVPVVSNEVTWNSLRLGLEASIAFGPRWRVTVEAAWVPYTRMRNEDSHWLRQDPSDLGPAPNVINEGEGRGGQGEIELRWTFHDGYELALGARYWRLKTTDGTNQGAGGTFPLVFQESERMGVTLGLSKSW